MAERRAETRRYGVETGKVEKQEPEHTVRNSFSNMIYSTESKPPLELIALRPLRVPLEWNDYVLVPKRLPP